MERQAGKTCVIYCRVSSEEQVGGTSLDTQEVICREYATRQGWQVLATFIQEGESAKTADRTQLEAAIKFCARKNPRVDYFVCPKLDRSARHAEDYFAIRATLRRHGTHLASATQPIDHTPAGKLMETMLAGIAEFDNDVRAERCKAGMVARVRQGVWCWPAPLGYRRLQVGENITPNPATAPHIRYAFEEYARGFVTYRRLADRLTARGLRTATGKPIRYQNVEQILKNPIYCGIIEVWGEQHVGSFPPIVAESLWRQCQARYSSRPVQKVHASPRSANNALFPLRSFIRCAHCGDPLTGSCPRNRQGRKYPYYHHPRRTCIAPSRYIPKRVLEQRFVDWLRRHRPSPEVLRVWRLVMLDTLRQKADVGRAQYSERNRAIDALKLERQRVFDLHRSGTYADEDFKEQLRLIDARIKENNLLSDQKVAGEANLETILNEAINEFARPDETWLELESDFYGRLRFQERVFERNLLWDGQGVSKTSNETFRFIYRVNQETRGDLSKVVDFVRENWNEIVAELQRWYGDPA